MEGFQLPNLRGDRRLLLLGKTDSGKSFMARYLLKLMRVHGWRIVIVDPKKDWQRRIDQQTGRRTMIPYGGSDRATKKGTVDRPVLVSSFNKELAVQIITPAEWDKRCDALAAAIMREGNTIIYFDEVTQLVTPASVPRNFHILWTQGRSINVGAWCGTQRPVGIPVIVKDQAEVWFIFRLTRKEDRQVVEGHIPTDHTPELVDRALPKRWFWFYSDEMDDPILVRPLKIARPV